MAGSSGPPRAPTPGGSSVLVQCTPAEERIIGAFQQEDAEVLAELEGILLSAVSGVEAEGSLQRIDGWPVYIAATLPGESKEQGAAVPDLTIYFLPIGEERIYYITGISYGVDIIPAMETITKVLPYTVSGTSAQSE